MYLLLLTFQINTIYIDKYSKNAMNIDLNAS